MIGAIPWAGAFYKFLVLLPFGKNLPVFRKFSLDSVRARIAKGGKYKDLFYYMVRLTPQMDGILNVLTSALA